MTVATDAKLAEKAVNAIRFLSIDAVEQANSGHPGMPMGAADAAFVLWTRFLRHDPTCPEWQDRDRFILSAGHGCMLHYSLLHLFGYALPIEEIKNFRQWGSATPGHPEFGHTVGVEATTGPLGQGISNATGMALSRRMLASRFNGSDDSFQPVRHRIYVIASDGDLMEGVSAEAGSMAGHLKLGELIVLYDDNRITIEGDTDLAFSEDVTKRYEAYGWHVDRVDGHDHEALATAIEAAQREGDRPSLIAMRTTIARGAVSKEGSHESHGAPLGADEVRATKEKLGWPLEPTFHVPTEVRDYFRAVAAQGTNLRTAWETEFAGWRSRNAEHASSWDEIWGGNVPSNFTAELLEAAPQNAGATRAHSGKVLQVVAERVPALVGGSADLAPSTKTLLEGTSSVLPGEYTGRNLHFGIREHAMGAVMNGMLYHGAFRPYGATFLVFSDYMRPPIRLAALSKLPAIYVFTHDSIFLGEDGPTHEPVEHAWALRTIPGLDVFRPADGFETALAWGEAMRRQDGPTALLLTRHKVPPIERSASGELAQPSRGAYLVSGEGSPEAILAATGSELHLAVGAAARLRQEGRRVHVVSIPCYELFKRQDAGYRSRLFPAGVPIATVEAGCSEPWAALSGIDGLNIGVDRFGASAPAGVLAEKYGMTEEAVYEKVKSWL